MAPKKALTATKVAPKKAADVGAYIERQAGQTMKPKPIIAGYYGVRGERLRFTVHEGALRLPSASLGMIRSQLELIQASGHKDIAAMNSYKLPHVDAVAIRPSTDPKLLAEGVVLTELSTQTHTPPPRLDPTTGTMLHFQPTTRTAAENRKLGPSGAISGIEPERIRGGGDGDAERNAALPTQPQQTQPATLQAPAPSTTQQAPAPRIVAAPIQPQGIVPATPIPRALPTQAAPHAVVAPAPVVPIARTQNVAVPQASTSITATPAPAARPAAAAQVCSVTAAVPPKPVAQASAAAPSAPLATVRQPQTQRTTVLQPARTVPYGQVAPTTTNRPVTINQTPSVPAQPPRPVQQIVAPIARTGGIRNPLSAAAVAAPATQPHTTTHAPTYSRPQVTAAPHVGSQASSFIAPPPTHAQHTTSAVARAALAAPHQPQRQVVQPARAVAPQPVQQHRTIQTTVLATSSTTRPAGSLAAGAVQSSQAVSAAIARQQTVSSAGHAAAAVSRPVAMAPAAAPISSSTHLVRAAPNATTTRPPTTVSSAPMAAASITSSKPPVAAPVTSSSTTAASVSASSIPKETPKPAPPAPKVVPLNKTPTAQYEQLAPAANDEMQVEIAVDRPDWFDKDKASDLEMTLLPEWFNQSAPHRTHKSYVNTRNAILTISSKLGNRYVTKTLMRRTVPGDVGSMHRLHDFLVAYSLINADAINDSTPTHPKLRDIRFAWTLPLRDALTEAVVQVAQPSDEGVQVDWEQVAKRVGCGVKPIDCEREFLSLTSLSTEKSSNETIERSITPDAMDVDGPDSSRRSGAADGRVSWLKDIARNADAQVVEAATNKALEVSPDLEQAQKRAQAALVLSAATKAARLEEENLARSLAELHEQRLLKLENRMAMLDDVECLLETERAALELERRDLYTARCRHWFGGGAS